MWGRWKLEHLVRGTGSSWWARVLQKTEHRDENIMKSVNSFDHGHCSKWGLHSFFGLKASWMTPLTLKWLQFGCYRFSERNRAAHTVTTWWLTANTYIYMIIYRVFGVYIKSTHWQQCTTMEALYLFPVWVTLLPTQCYSDICCCEFAVHLWRYRGGYPALTECLKKLNNNKVSRLYFYSDRNCHYICQVKLTWLSAVETDK